MSFGHSTPIALRIYFSTFCGKIQLQFLGNASFFAKPEDSKSLIALFSWAKENDLPIFILGGGSNLVVSDDGIDKLVISTEAFDFCERMQSLGVTTLICTDISKDGAMLGTNHELYQELSKRFDMQIIASGGVSTIDDVKKLAKLDIYGAIIGKAYYTKAIDIADAIEVAK